LTNTKSRHLMQLQITHHQRANRSKSCGPLHRPPAADYFSRRDMPCLTGCARWRSAERSC
jgi:hypothetical protein